MQDTLKDHSIISNGTQPGYKTLPAFDLYTDTSVSSGYGGTFAVPAGSSLDVILAARDAQAEKFASNRK